MTPGVETWLSLDLSSPVGTLAMHRFELGDRPQLIREDEIGTSSQHSERLIESLMAALSAEKMELANIDRYVTTTGPGSFTGLRIAYATLKAFALSLGKPIETVSGSEARLLAWLESLEGVKRPSTVSVFTHVALERYSKCTFSRTNERWARISDELVGKEEPNGVGTLFPLRARFLGDHLLDASTRQTHATLEAWISLSPEYLGSTRF